MKRALVRFGSWTVCETDDDTHSGVKGTEVFAEHDEGCNETTTLDKSSWSWEFDDATVAGIDVCWKCGGAVPAAAVALVQLHNWDRKNRNP